MSRFTLFPAIDLRRGRCVRLEQGAAERETVYESNPLAAVTRFADAGARWVHVVDLDAAFGEGSNRAQIQEIAESGMIRVQTGGGLRSNEDLEEVLERGAARAVLGTAAIENPELVSRAVERWGADRIAVGLDARGRKPAVRGWREEIDVDIFSLGRSLVERGVRTFIYTDIERDGMLGGPNVQGSVELARHTGADVIVSGGIGSLNDVVAIAAAAEEEPRIVGAILGKSLYEGRVTLGEALERIRR